MRCSHFWKANEMRKNRKATNRSKEESIEANGTFSSNFKNLADDEARCLEKHTPRSTWY